MVSDKLRGSLALMAAALLYGLYGTSLRLMGTVLGPYNAALLDSSVVIGLLAVYFLWHRKQWTAIHSKHWRLFLFWMIVAMPSVFMLFYAFNHLGMGTTYFLFYASMITFSIIWGKVSFGEQIDRYKLAAIGLCLFGLAIIYAISFNRDLLLFGSLALASGVTTSLWNSYSKKLSSHYGGLQLVLVSAVGGVVLGLLGMLLAHEGFPALQFNAWVGIGLNVLTQVGAGWLCLYGFKHLEVQVASVILPLEVVFGSLFGLLLYGEILSWQAVLGGCLIASGAFITPLRNLLTAKPISKSGA